MAGIFGVVSKKDCVENLFWGTHYLQHRAQDYCGLALYDGEFQNHPRKGLIKQQFLKENLKALNGNFGIGAVASDEQPVPEHSRRVIFTFDGNVINYEDLKNRLLEEGILFSSHSNQQEISDSVLVSKVIAREKSFEKGVEKLVELVKGDFAIVALTGEGVYAARGWGRKPLILGKKDGSYAVSSESNSFVNTGFEIFRDVEPGEIVLLNKEGIHQVKKLDLQPIKYGTFEWVYTAYPPSVIDGRNVAVVRMEIGKALARRYPVEADIVSPIPNSGIWHATGYYLESGIPNIDVFTRYDYSDRSFTPQEQADRDREAKTKLIILAQMVRGKRIIIVDDSIVRGTQTLNKVRELREAGAREVHARIACPPLMAACKYGKTTKKDEDCIARRKSIGDIEKELELDSLGYATVGDLEQALKLPREKLCLECWTGTS